MERVANKDKTLSYSYQEGKRVLKNLGIAYIERDDGTLFVEGDIDLRPALDNPKLKALPDLSCVVVRGNFNCMANELTSLKGAPQSVGGDFWCSSNNLISLKYSPRYVGGRFSCVFNDLKNLEGAPEIVDENFRCAHNFLESLEGAPKIVRGDFDCEFSSLKTLKGASQYVGGEFVCHYNKLKNLDGVPTSFASLKSDFGEFTSYESIPEYLLTLKKEEKIKPSLSKELILEALGQSQEIVAEENVRKTISDELHQSIGSQKDIKLFSLIEEGDVSKLRKDFDDAFYERRKIELDSTHLKIALFQENKKMVRFLVNWGARITKDEVDNFAKGDSDKKSVYTKMLRPNGMK